MRLLGAVRLSHDNEATNSPDVQRDKINGFKKLHDHSVVQITEDLDVSGKVSVFERPDLGPWLTDPAKIAQWDLIVVSKLDRLSRSVIDFATLYQWCQANRKSIVSVSENLDFSTAMGRMFAQILVMFAEFERERASERRREAKVKIQSEARWNGGKVPFGYEAVKIAKGWILQPHLVNSAVVREVADRIIAGQSANSICKDLTARKIPTSTGKSLWRSDVLIRILRSPVIRGYVTTNGNEIVRDADGMPVTRESLIDDETWIRLQAALDKGSQVKVGHRIDASLLLRVAYCAVCGSPMYSQIKRNRGYGYYVCGSKVQGHGCTENGVRSETLEEIISGALLAECADVPMQEKIVTAAEDHSGELVRITESITALQDQFMADKLSADMFATMVSKLEARQKTLEALPSVPEAVEYVKTGQTFSEHWGGLTVSQRHTFLHDKGIKADVLHIDDQGLSLSDFDPDGSTRIVFGTGLKVTVHLGMLAELRDMASQSLAVVRAP